MCGSFFVLIILYGYFIALRNINRQEQKITIMNIQSKITKQIELLCGKTNKVSSFGWHFTHKELHYFYVPDKENKFIRITIPHIVKVNDMDTKSITDVINETNREVKFVKAVILDNGSISISYDHKIAAQENLSEIAHHIINTLDFASSYLIKKMKEKLC